MLICELSLDIWQQSYCTKERSLAFFIYQHGHKPSDCQVGPLTAGVGPSLNQGMQLLPPILALDTQIRERVEKRSEKKILFSLDLCFHLLHILGAIRQKGKKGSYKSFSKGREKKWAATTRKKKEKGNFEIYPQLLSCRARPWILLMNHQPCLNHNISFFCSHTPLFFRSRTHLDFQKWQHSSWAWLTLVIMDTSVLAMFVHHIHCLLLAARRGECGCLCVCACVGAAARMQRLLKTLLSCSVSQYCIYCNSLCSQMNGVFF